MGAQDREDWPDTVKNPEQISAAEPAGHGLTRALQWGPAAILVFWLAVMGLLYLAMNHYLQPKPAIVTAEGELLIPRARDGHFYTPGLVNGRRVNFLVDTGASLVSVSDEFARAAGIGPGEPTVFRTANGERDGQIVTGIPVSIGPVSVSSVRVGVGLSGDSVDDALLGQSFLSKFEILLQKDRMILRPKSSS